MSFDYSNGMINGHPHDSALAHEGCPDTEYVEYQDAVVGYCPGHDDMWSLEVKIGPMAGHEECRTEIHDYRGQIMRRCLTHPQADEQALYVDAEQGHERGPVV